MTASTLSPARLWRTHPRELVALSALAAAALMAAAGAAWSTPSLDQITESTSERAAPAPPPLLVRKIAPTDALTLNGKIPLATGPNPAAQPFSMAKLDEATRARALECLTSAVYYEAANEPTDGQRAVAQVVLNRVRHPAFPSTVCGVVYQGSTRATGCQFTFTCDGSLRRQPMAAKWSRARQVAEAALNGSVFAPAGLATHYHANYVVPYWASSLAKNAVIGAHLFYRWAGSWGRPPAFTQRYARQEPSSEALKATALAAYESRPARIEAAEVAAEVAEIPGAEPLKAPSGRINIRFNLAKLAEARKAADDATTARLDYVEKVEASDNLRWTLSGGGGAKAPADQKPLGKSSGGNTSSASATGGAD